VWNEYVKEKKTRSGLWTGKVGDGALIFMPVDGGKPLRCDRKPNTQEVFLGTGALGGNPQFCAAINRHVLADPADWRNPAKFYQAEPCNWYSKFFHEHSLDHKAYGFCYDDVSEQAAFFSGKGQNLTVTLYWDRVFGDVITRVVHEHVKPPEMFDGKAYECLHFCAVGHVRSAKRRAALDQSGHGLDARGLVQVGHDDYRPLGCETTRDGRPDAFGAAGHDGHPIVQFHVGLSMFKGRAAVFKG
jgi:hypothetical protein